MPQRRAQQPSAAPLPCHPPEPPRPLPAEQSFLLAQLPRSLHLSPTVFPAILHLFPFPHCPCQSVCVQQTESEVNNWIGAGEPLDVSIQQRLSCEMCSDRKVDAADISKSQFPRSCCVWMRYFTDHSCEERGKIYPGMKELPPKIQKRKWRRKNKKKGERFEAQKDQKSVRESTISFSFQKLWWLTVTFSPLAASLFFFFFLNLVFVGFNDACCVCHPQNRCHRAQLEKQRGSGEDLTLLCSRRRLSPPATERKRLQR